MERRNGQHPNHPNPDPVDLAPLWREVWDRRRNRETYTEIAEAMGISRSTAHKYFKEGLKLQMPQAAEEERILSIQLLEEQLAEAKKATDRLAKDPEKMLKGIELQVKIGKQIRELMGLDAPTKFQGSVTHTTPIDSELQELADELAREQEQEARKYGDRDRLHNRQRAQGSGRGRRQ